MTPRIWQHRPSVQVKPRLDHHAGGKPAEGAKPDAAIAVNLTRLKYLASHEDTR